MKKLFTFSAQRILFSLVAFLAVNASLYSQCDPDLAGPLVTCLPDITVECISDVPPVSTTVADYINQGGVVVDFCTSQDALLMSSSEVSSGDACVGSILRTYEFEDEAGNVGSCSREILIQYNQLLSLGSCPSEVVEFLDNDCEAAFQIQAPEIISGCNLESAQFFLTEDNIELAPIDFTSGEILSFTFEGDVPRTCEFRVMDECGGVESCSINISLIDNVSPTCSSNNDIEIQLGVGQCDTIIDFVLPEGFDNCGSNSLILDFEDAMSTPEFTHFGSSIGGSIAPIVDNPALDYINSSSKVLEFSRVPDALSFAGISNLSADLELQTSTVSQICLDVYSTVLSNMSLKLENSSNGFSDWIISEEIESILEWNTICFDLEEASIEAPFAAGRGGIYKQISFFPAFGTTDSPDNDLYYIDNVIMYSIVSSPIPGEAASGDAFPIGTTTVNYLIEDASGNTSECAFDVVVNEFVPSGLACRSTINLSIDAFTCESEVTPDMVLTTVDLGCKENCEVTIMLEDGTIRSSLFTSDDVGQSFMYQVCCGDLCCMGTVNVEDKTPPQITCVNDTITCADLIVFPDPIFTENCSIASLELLNETFEAVDCNDPVLQQVIVRTYQAIDGAGNVSNTCEQRLSISKFDIGTVQSPLNQSIQLECGVPYPTDAEGNPDPLVYGSPRLSGINLWPEQYLECNLMVNYEDMTIQTALNTTTVVRTWSATNWYCGQDSTVQFVQIFNISDTQGPIMTCPDDMSVTTSGFDCTASIVLPSIAVSDVCGDVVKVNVQYEGGFLEGSNGGSASLPNGTSEVVYTAFDSNGNSSSCSFFVTVADQEQPTPICEQFTVVSLTNDGTAIIDASSFDDGSFDACGPVTLSVRRMTANCDPTDIVLGESISFCCDDLGVDQQVILRVTDQGGLWNECMVIVEVQDKIPPILVQGLPDITLSCEFPFSTEDTEQFGSIVMDFDAREDILLTAEYVEFSGEAKDGLVLGNCVELISDEFTFSNIGSCGTGSATRVLTFANQQGLSVTDVQNISFINPSPFTFADITFPGDISFTNLCDIMATHPDNLPAGFGYPTYVEDGCDQVGLDYDDQVIDNSDGALSCYKIIRTWTLADWCQNTNGTFATFEDTQIITVSNSIAPEITGDCADRSQCSYDVDCGPMYVELVNSGTDDCTGDEFLNWTYAIDAFSDGSIDITGSSSDASGTYPVGVHTIYWTLSDACGNEDLCNYTFEIENCKTPTPICLDNLTTEITPMDTDGDTEADTERVMITASFFDGGSYHTCGTPVQLSFSSDVDDTLRIFGCEDIGLQAIQLWATDVNGNQDFCTTSLDVQNNMDEGLCPIMLTVDITGELKTETDEMISEAIVVLEGSEMIDETAADGNYSFVDMPIGNSYTILPSKDIDPLNGVTTLDIILIQKHILGLQTLDSPYKLIAADVNHSDNVSGSDIIQLRKMILGAYEEFPNNTSWRFIDNSHTFINPLDPWTTEIPESFVVGPLNTDMVVDFRGVKIGDVNGSAIPNTLLEGHIDVRGGDKLNLVVDEVMISGGSPVWIPFYADNFEGILGYQLGLRPKNVEILDIRGAALDLSEANYQIDQEDGAVKIVWHEGTGVTVGKNTALFEIQVIAKQNISSANILDLREDVMRNESYNSDLRTSGIRLSTRGRSIEEVDSKIEMNQNEPNPWMDQTTINIESSLTGMANFRVMDMSGKVVLQRNLDIVTGSNAIVLTKADLAATGVLYYELELTGFKIMKKMVLIR